eukprot:3933996-Rhodomonas_salina.2
MIGVRSVTFQWVSRLLAAAPAFPPAAAGPRCIAGADHDDYDFSYLGPFDVMSSPELKQRSWPPPAYESAMLM